MDDVRALQDASLRDRQERDQLRHTLLAEQDRNKNLQMRLDREVEQSAKLLEAVSQRRRSQQGEVTAAMSYQKTLLELTALQQTHIETLQAHHEEAEALRNQLDVAQRTASQLASELDSERAGRAAQVEDLTGQLRAHEATAAAEVAVLHESYGGRLSLLEDFKNQLLADKAAAEERWAQERAALKARQAESAAAAAAAGGAGGGGEVAWKARLMRLRAETDAVRRERDAAHAALRAAGVALPPPPAPPGTVAASASAPAAAGGVGVSGGLSAPSSSSRAAAAAGGGHEAAAPGPGRGGFPPPRQQQQQQQGSMHPQPPAPASGHAYEPGRQPPAAHHPSHLQPQHQQPPYQQPPPGQPLPRGPLRSGGLGAAPRMALGGPMGRPGPGAGLGAAYGGGGGGGSSGGAPYMAPQQGQYGQYGQYGQAPAMGNGGLDGAAAAGGQAQVGTGVLPGQQGRLRAPR
ncbi:hypothetical protein PLESTB_000186700 [Pleodorina starrii]|uniref:Uncharacterized protein n=1 Tax=Pleodorina starrii TaxID=330485 RepID=A0A9W6EYD8_9CHLO|nr:hypothetical protein PLESTB_000186700 [Pleodorina starrii]